jgi:hypothetical protein
MELALDVIMICGGFGMPYGIMRNAYSATSRFALETGDGHPLAEIARSLRIKLLSKPPSMLAAAPRIGRPREKCSQTSLKRRIFESNRMKATEPRDHIIALLAVAHDASALGLSPVPTRSAAMVYTETTSALILRNSDLQILCACQFPWFPKPHEVLPSWVPDFSMTYPSMIWSPNDSHYSAGGTGQAISRVDASTRTLTLTGVRFDTICTFGQSWESKVGKNFSSNAHMQDLLRLSHLIEETYGGGKALHEVIWRTPIADVDTMHSDGYRTLRRANYRMYSGFQALSSSYGQSRGLSDEQRLLQSQEYRIQMARVYMAGYDTPGRRNFVSSKGYLGVGPHRLEEGDLICVFFGAEVPFILRKLSSGGYHLVGECYVHGIMDGEVLRGDYTSNEFNLV